MFNWNAWRFAPEDPAAASTGTWGDAATYQWGGTP